MKPLLLAVKMWKLHTTKFIMFSRFWPQPAINSIVTHEITIIFIQLLSTFTSLTLHDHYRNISNSMVDIMLAGMISYSVYMSYIYHY